MNRKEKELNTSVGFRLSEKEKHDLDNLCEILNVSKSEFLRNHIERINQTIKGTLAMKNLNDKKETGKIMEELTGTKQMVFTLDEHEGEIPAETTEGLIEQLKNHKEH